MVPPSPDESLAASGPPPLLDDEEEEGDDDPQPAGTQGTSASGRTQRKERSIALEDTPCYEPSRAMTQPRRPSFAQQFPQAPELDVLVDAFARGDYRHVRSEGPRLAKSTDDPEVRKAAETLVERTKPDRLAVGLVALTGILLVAMSAYWIVHGKAPPGSAPKPPPVEHPR